MSSTNSNSSEPSLDDRSSIDLKLPFTLSEKVFFGITSFISIYEIAFWLLFDHPITLHSKGNTPLLMLAISASLNSIPHLFCGTYGLLYITRSYKSAALLLFTKYKQQKELNKLKANNSSQKHKETIIKQYKEQLNKLPIYQKGGLRFCIYVLYISLFTLMQSYFWWFPYFFGIVTDMRFQRMQKKLKGIVSILPQNDTYLVPSAEHTLLFPLSIIAWILSIKMFFKYRAVIITQVRTRWTNYTTLGVFAAVICYLPTSMACINIKKDASNNPKEMKQMIETEQDVGAAIVAVAIIFIVFVLFVALFWAPHYIKAKNYHKKDE